MATKRTRQDTGKADDEPAIKKRVPEEGRGEEKKHADSLPSRSHSGSPSPSPSAGDGDEKSDASRQGECGRSPVTKSSDKQQYGKQRDGTDDEGTSSTAKDDEGEAEGEAKAEAESASENENADADDKKDKGAQSERTASSAPPIPNEEIPPLPDEPAPDDQPQKEDDGWDAVWDDASQAYYFYNRFTNRTQWENPRVPTSSLLERPPSPKAADPTTTTATTKRSIAGGYNPAIHGDYDPNASYAQVHEEGEEEHNEASQQAVDLYAAVGSFNRFTGRWQTDELNPDRFSQENKSSKQIDAFFDAGAAANRHDGRSLKAERSARKLSKKEIRAFTQKKKERKEEKKRAWLRD